MHRRLSKPGRAKLLKWRTILSTDMDTLYEQATCNGVVAMPRRCSTCYLEKHGPWVAWAYNAEDGKFYLNFKAK